MKINMPYIIKNIVCFFVLHIFANIGVCIEGLLILYAITAMDDFPPIIILNMLFYTILLIIFGRLLILPISYKKLENSEHFSLISKFIKILKESLALKIIVLILAYFSYFSLGFSYNNYNYKERLLGSLYFGLLGNYLALFIYWYIEDIVKNLINSKARK